MPPFKWKYGNPLINVNSKQT